MTDNEINEILKKLRESSLSGYLIAQKTCITETTIGNYRRGKTYPTAANAKLLEYFFMEQSGLIPSPKDSNTKNVEPIVPYSGNIDAPNANNENINALINILKDTLAEKDRQIDRLLSIIEKNNLQKQ